MCDLARAEAILIPVTHQAYSVRIRLYVRSYVSENQDTKERKASNGRGESLVTIKPYGSAITGDSHSCF
jgi:hypothetical protein